MTNPITVSVIVNADLEKVWDCFVTPLHIMNWNAAHESWHCPAAINELKEGGSFCYTMAARDESFQFDLVGTYNKITNEELIDVTMGDGRAWLTTFEMANGKTIVKEIFEPEHENSIELQEQGWQAILDNFAKYVESVD